MYQIKMTIGDWSKSNHGASETFLISSNLPVEDVREAHFRIKDVTDIDLESVCSNYDEDEIDSETMEILQEMGFVFRNKTGMGPEITYPEEMARIWMFLLMRANPQLQLELLKDETPSIHFVGYDEKGRHIGEVGYGLFKAELHRRHV